MFFNKTPRHGGLLNVVNLSEASQKHGDDQIRSGERLAPSCCSLKNVAEHEQLELKGSFKHCPQYTGTGSFSTREVDKNPSLKWS
jgi:hypothetical protein